MAGRARNFSAADEIQALMAYRHECAAQDEAEKAVVAAREVMNERRMEYLDAHRKLEVVKRLEEKARAAHHYETMREEQAAFDDFSGRQFSRRSVNPA
jgi:flagellar export protein FliJ